MEYYLYIWSITTFIEKRLKDSIVYEELEEAVGFSYRHIREIFQKCTKISLSRYVLGRRIANAAFDIVHTNRSLMDIAVDYGFESYDTFTRAFKRETGVVPSEFRKGGYLVGRSRIATGAYAPAILKDNKNLLQLQLMEVDGLMKNSMKTEDSSILFGVPKVEYTFEECTPFPACLKACLNYMGQNIDYAYLMAASGAAFRLRWNTKFWDGGNVDIQCIYEGKYEAFTRSMKAAGRTCTILERENSNKEGFIEFIKAEIDEGRPVIALGIIGPPEACIITGYLNNGETLLGWNFFQTNTEFAKDTKFYETGYFMCDTWWENPNTRLLLAIGEELEPLVSVRDILANGIDVLSKESIHYQNSYTNDYQNYAGGQAAFDAWEKAIGNDDEFSENTVLPVLFERLMCQNDAQVMVGEGRSYAACFLEWVGRTNLPVSELCNEAANCFRMEAECTFRMNEPKGGFEQNEITIRRFAETAVRKQIQALIVEAKQKEARACEIMKRIVEMLDK